MGGRKTAARGGLFVFATSSLHGKDEEMTNSALNTATPTNRLALRGRSWFIILFLVIFAPVGLWLMWRHGSWSTKSKSIISVIIGLFMGLLTIGVINAPPTITLSVPQKYDELIKTDGSKYIVSGEVSSIYEVTLTINNDTVSIQDTKFEHTILLNEGENKVRIAAINKNGSDDVEFTIHRTTKAELAERERLKQEQENLKAEQARKEAEKTKAAEEKKLAEEAEKAAQVEAQKAKEAAAAKVEADKRAAEEAARKQTQQQAPSNTSSGSSSGNNSPNSGVTSTVSGYCNDGTYVTGNPAARGKANACYGHGGWRDY